jgi:hypothetical protein
VLARECRTPLISEVPVDLNHTTTADDRCVLAGTDLNTLWALAQANLDRSALLLHSGRDNLAELQRSHYASTAFKMRFDSMYRFMGRYLGMESPNARPWPERPSRLID